jgi:hypothetical protein
MDRFLIVIGLCSLWLAPQASSYPILWVEEPNQPCVAHPTKPEGEHKALVPDRCARDRRRSVR